MFVANREKIEKLQEIIREGIGDRAKGVFALEIGVTPEHFSRLMKAGYELIPNEKTVIALAKALPNVTKEELFSLLEITPTFSIDNKRPTEICNDIYLELRDDSERILHNNRLYENVIEFINILTKLSSFPNVQVSNSIISNEDPSDFLRSCLIELDYVVNDVKFNFSFVVIYYDIERGGKENPHRALIERLLFDKEQISRLGYHVEGVINNPYVCSFAKLTSDEDDNSELITTIDYGIGFRITNENSNAISEFIKSNQYILQGREDELKDVYEKIAYIMSEKTKIPFTFYKGTDFVSIYSASLELNSMTKKIIEKYAKQLGVTKYGKIHVLKEEKIEEDELFDVEE